MSEASELAAVVNEGLGLYRSMILSGERQSAQSIAAHDDAQAALLELRSRAEQHDYVLDCKFKETHRANNAERERDHMRAALEGLANVAEQYMDTERGDLDGWIDRARSILAALSQPRNTQP